MKAAVNTIYGPPEVLRIKEIPKPVPKPNEVLIKVHASTVNRTDCGFLRGKPFITRFFSGLSGPKYPCLGCEFAGVVEGTGSAVTRFKLGDRVFGFSDTRFGGHAEYMVVGEKEGIAVIPENIPFETAAAITEGAHYALCDLRAAKIATGQRWLINGGTGAIGSAAVQLAKYFGVHVTAVCATSNLERVRLLGPDRVIDYTAEDFTKLPEKFDVVFDAVGKRSFGECKPIMTDKGIYMSTELGPNSENPFLGLIAPLMRGKKVLFPLPFVDQKDVEFLGMLVKNGQFKPMIDRTYPLEQIAEAYRYVETGMKTGNVVITIN
jgi:NADPH:quinone reductase-like Zn-dependent oxidoreductase